jgi:hypothetical protein
MVGTLVSKSWNTLIGGSQTFKKRVVFKVNVSKKMKSLEFPEVLNEGQRKYENLSIDEDLPPNMNSWMKLQQWKNVSVYSGKLDIHPWIGSSLEVLKLTCVKSSNSIDNLIFPVLKKLQLLKCDAKTMSSFVNHHPKIVEVRIHCDGEPEKLEAAIGILAQNPRITKLDVCELIIEQSVDDKLVLQLKALNIPDAFFPNHVFDFVKQQLPTLEYLCLKRRLTINTLLTIWNEFGKISTLSFDLSSLRDDDKEIALKPLIKLSLLKIVNFGDPDRQNVYKLILRSSPNLEELHLCILTLDLFKFAVLNLKKLHTIRSDLILFNVERTYNEMKAMNPNVNGNIMVLGDSCEKRFKQVWNKI